MCFLLSNPHGGLFLDPGLGKTSITLAVVKTLLSADEIKGVLLIGPLDVIYNTWPDEINKWDSFNGISYTILHGKNKDSLWGERKDIYMINPEGLSWLYDELAYNLGKGKKSPFDALWVDESTKFKNMQSGRFKLLKDLLVLFKRRHIMTGTPMPKDLIDVWPQIYILDRGNALGSNFYKFRKKYFYSEDWNKHDWKLKDGSEDKINQLTSNIVLNMAAKDYLNLPEKSFNTIKVKLPKTAMIQYKKLENDFFVRVNSSDVSASSMGILSMKSQQMANGNIYEDIPEELTKEEIKEFKKTRKVIQVHKAKINATRNLIEELNGKPVLIAYHYKHDLIALKKEFGDIPHIGSGVSSEDRKDIIREWNKGNIPILAGNPTSMAYGLNLQEGGHDILWYSTPWSIDMYLQFNDRIHRQGVKKKVRIHHLVAENTIDELILSVLQHRDKSQLEFRERIKWYRDKS